MINLAQLTDQDFEKMAKEIQEISDNSSEDSLFETIGNALHDSGLTVQTNNSLEMFQVKAFNEGTEKFNLRKSVSFVDDTTALSTDQAKEEGKKFWERFKDKLQSTICNDSKIKALLDGDGTLKDYLVAGIPLILAALGMAVLNPLALAIIASVLALVVKVGFKTYCDIA